MVCRGGGGGGGGSPPKIPFRSHPPKVKFGLFACVCGVQSVNLDRPQALCIPTSVLPTSFDKKS